MLKQIIREMSNYNCIFTPQFLFVTFNIDVDIISILLLSKLFSATKGVIFFHFCLENEFSKCKLHFKKK